MRVGERCSGEMDKKVGAGGGHRIMDPLVERTFEVRCELGEGVAVEAENNRCA